MYKMVLLSKYSALPKRLFCAGIAFASVTLQTVSKAEVDDLQSRLVKMQSQDIELPEDFMVRVDGNKLQVALVSLGAVGPQVSTSSLLVSLLNASGEEKVATTNAQGIAEFTDVEPGGIQALVVADEKSHVALPMMLLSPQEAAMRGVVAKEVRLPLMPSNRQEIIASIARGSLPSSGVGGASSEKSGEFFPLSNYKLRSVNPFSVRLQRDGKMLGKVIVADRTLAENLRYAKLTFLRNNHVVARTDSNAIDGSFDVPNLSPGAYGVIASGPAGYSSFSFEVLPPLAPSLIGEGVSSRPVSFVQSDANDRLYVFLCPPKFVPRISEKCREVYGQPMSDVAGAQPVSGLTMGNGAGLASSGMSAGGGGGFGGGGSFGGGGGFGGAGGGLAGLIGVGGLVAVGAIVAAQDNNNNTVLTSPITP